MIALLLRLNHILFTIKILCERPSTTWSKMLDALLS